MDVVVGGREDGGGGGGNREDDGGGGSWVLATSTRKNPRSNSKCDLIFFFYVNLKIRFQTQLNCEEIHLFYLAPFIWPY